MTRIIDEQLSALFDGELPVEQEAMLLRRLERDSESRDKLARFGLIGELVRDASAQTSVTQSSALDISARVSAALAEETASQPDASTSSLPAGKVGFVGAAIAASIALVVMLNLTDLSNPTYLPGVDAVARSAPAAHNDHSSARLTRYLVSHAQFSNSPSRQLVDTHLAMASVEPAAWTGNE